MIKQTVSTEVKVKGHHSTQSWVRSDYQHRVNQVGCSYVSVKSALSAQRGISLRFRQRGFSVQTFSKVTEVYRKHRG